MPKPLAALNSASVSMSRTTLPRSVKVGFMDPLNDSEWDRTALSHPDASFFHTSAWAKVLCKTYGHRPVYLRITQNSELVALVPVMEVRSPLTGTRGVSLPFTDLCAPLLFCKDSTNLVMEKLTEIGRERNWSHFEVRGGSSPHELATPSSKFYVHELDLRHPEETLFAAFTSSVRRAIRKAEQSALNVQISKSKEAVLAFYRLHVQTRRKHGLPPQPVSFFQHIYDEVISQNLGFVVLSKAGDRPIAAAIYFRLGNKAVYKFGASDETQLETRGNNLTMWAGIRHLVSTGAESLHFGRSSADNDGLRRFKLGWGAREELFQYFRFNPIAGTWLTGRDRTTGFHTTVFRHLPLALNRLAGAIIYPHLD